MRTLSLLTAFIFMTLFYNSTQGQTRRADAVATIQGDTVYQILQPDAIPAIRRPKFVEGKEAAAQTAKNEMVMGVLLNGEARAYSLWQLDAHEIVNDQAGDIKFAVTWRPLCHSGVVYDRQIADTTLTLIVSGRLWRNSLIMLDVETNTFWSHITGEGLIGPLKGAQLAILPAVQTTWGEWIKEYPNSKALKKEHQIRSSHYQDYFSDPDRIGIFGTHRLIKRLPAKSLAHGLAIHPFALAVPDETIHEGGFYTTTLGPHDILIVRGLDDGVRAFEILLGSTHYHFEKGETPGELIDDKTASTWDMQTGTCLEGRLAGQHLTPIQITTAFWFAWSAFHSKTEIFTT